MSTIDLTDAEHAAVTALIRRAIEEDHFPNAPRLDPGDQTRYDRSHLRSAIVELHEQERSLHSSRLLGEETADAYLDWMLAEVERSGAVLIAEAGSLFIGFAAGWIVEDNLIEETPDSNRFGLVWAFVSSSVAKVDDHTVRVN